MMRNGSPWKDIAIPSTDFNVRHVLGKMAVPCFWGRDTEGACLFILELVGDHTTQYRKNIITVNGILVDLRHVSPGQQRLILKLENETNRDLFEGLCRTLATALTNASDSASSLTVALAHIRRWKAFFSGRGTPHLSAEEVRGLFAELIFLKELLERAPTQIVALSSWHGPEKSQHDFIFGSTAVEVKSTVGTERNSVRISSEDQLESLNEALFLRIYHLNSLANATIAKSLNELASSVRACLEGNESVEIFDRKLAKSGYAPLPDYDEPRFAVTTRRSFHVKESFPKLVRSGIPSGVFKLSYEIKLETMSSFMCTCDTVFASI